MANAPGYTGVITGIRIDPVDNGAPGDRVRIRSIGFRQPTSTRPTASQTPAHQETR